MKVFVTGASGFIGTAFVDELLRNGWAGQPVELVCLASRPESLVERWRGKVQICEGRLDTIRNHREVLHSCDYVFHLAAAASLRSGSDFAAANIDGTRSLLDALHGSTTLRRLVFTSTIGAVDRSPDDACDRPLDESYPCHPLSEYGRTKKVCEQMLAAETQLPWTIVRPTWVYGPGMREESHIRVLIRLVLAGKFPARFDFPGRVSLIHVEDLVKALVLTARDERAKGQTYFASDGKPVSLGGLFREMGELVGNSAAGQMACIQPLTNLMRALRRWLPLTVQNLFSDVLCADGTKLAALGFSPGVSRERGLLQTLRWHGGQLQPEVRQGSVTVITGAAGGLGSALAKQCYVAGHHLLLVDRDAQKLEALAKTLDARFMVLDLTRSTALEEVETYLAEKGLSLHWLINNAGAGVRGAVEELPFERQKLAIDLNCVALTYLSRLAIREFRKTGQGVLINIASSSAFQPLPYMAAYAASKAYVLQFSRALTGELLDTPAIRVVTVSPAGIDTGFQAAAGVKKHAREKLLSPWLVATRIGAAVKAGKHELTIGLPAMGMSLVARLLPGYLQIRLWRRLMGKMR